jgi:hypothetical protein
MPGSGSLSGCQLRSEKRLVPGIRPRKARQGRELPANSIITEASTAISTPSSTPARATAAAAKSSRHHAPQVAQLREVDQPGPASEA